MDAFRIHGDNIVECERIANIIIDETNPEHINISLISPSTIVYSLDFEYCGFTFSWDLELLPGFNKAGKRRWAGNIFDALKENGSFLDETPDVIVTAVEGNAETILYAIEFCSALQAGNQAWQRSGRAFSTGRTGCPYLYVVGFVNYELQPITRNRKSLRFPNPIVSYSYINFSKAVENFVAQVYVRSEEFDSAKNQDLRLTEFDENNFANQELSRYIVKRMCGLNTADEEQVILQKLFNVVLFLSKTFNPKTNFTPSQWNYLHETTCDIIDYSVETATFGFHKKTAKKGHHGQATEFLSLVDKYSVGFASKELPIGIIPANYRGHFANGLKRIYPSFDTNIIRKIASTKSHLILCVIKGFKPGGDDNRPDRGVLPLATMLSSTDVEIMTYLYGPIVSVNFNKLMHNPKSLAESNGLWKSILALSNYVVLDVPILSKRRLVGDEEVLLNTTELKNYYTLHSDQCNGLSMPAFSSVPREYHEDDVDTGIHFLFSHLLHSHCFEGLCNPPGGDWSGLSIISNRKEVRWLSLPRESEVVHGKRPDHVLELFGVFRKPLLLAIESKDCSSKLEYNVGTGLANYIRSLMDYVPNVERDSYASYSPWRKSMDYVHYEDYEVISAAAYLTKHAQPSDVVFENSNCDILFIMEPIRAGWSIEIIPNTRKTNTLKAFIKQEIDNCGFDGIVIY